MSAITSETRAVEYSLSIEMNAPAERVWQSLVDEVDAWWLSDFRVVGPESVLTLEAKPGGRLYESAPDGTGLLWFTVQQVMPGKGLDLIGHLSPDYGGPAMTMLSIRLEEEDGVTTVSVRDAISGRVAQENVASLESGWRWLFTDGWKAHVEKG